MGSNNLRECSRRLADKIVEIVLASIEDCSLRRMHREETIRFLTRMEINPDGSGLKQWDEKKIEISYWDSKGSLALLDRVIESPEFAECVKLTRATIDEKRIVAEALVYQFTRKVVEDLKDDDSDRQKVERTIQMLLDDVEHKPILRRSESWLAGVFPEEAIHFSSSARIRAVAMSDFEMPLRDYETRPEGWLSSTAILEVELITDDRIHLDREVSACIDALRLLRVVSIRTMMTETHADSLIWPQGTMCTNDISSPVFQFVLKKDDASALSALMQVVKNNLPAMDATTAIRTRPITEISLQRYRDALIQPGLPVEGRISLAMSALEALFLNEKDELSFKLALRTAVFLGTLGYDRETVFNDVREAYGIRSDYSHGKPVNGKKQAGALDLTKRGLDYVRASIQGYIQYKASYGRIKESKAKDKFLVDLDKALLNNRAYNQIIENGKQLSMIITR
jgi:hypothetical protein